MSDFSTNLQLPYLMPAQAQKHVTVNESLRRLDALVHMKANSRTTTQQPASPADGELWIAPPGKSGADWDLFANHAIAYYRDGAWEQINPAPGWFAFVLDEDELVVFDGAGWNTIGVAGSQDVFVTISPDEGEAVSADTTLETLSLTGGAGVQTLGDDTLKTVTVGLTDTGVAPGTYGGAAKYISVTADAQGRLTALSEGPLGALAAKDAVDAAPLIADGVITLPKHADLDAARVIGRAAGAGPGAPQALGAAELRAMLNVEDGATADMSGAQIKTLYDAEAALSPAEVLTLEAMRRNGRADAALYLDFEAGLYASRGRPRLLSELSTFARTGPEWGADRWGGDLQVFAGNTPAIPRGAGYQCFGARANLLTDSEQFGQAAWSKGRSAIGATDAVAAPDGSMTAEKLVDTAESGSHRMYKVTPVGLGTYCFSIYLKAGELKYAGIAVTNQVEVQRHRIRIDLTTGEAASTDGSGGYSVKDAGDGWWRCAVCGTLEPGDTGAGVFLYTGIQSGLSYVGDGSGLYAWGAQLEAGAGATPYIRAEGTAGAVEAPALTAPLSLKAPRALSGVIGFRPGPDVSGARWLFRTDESGGHDGDNFIGLQIVDGELRFLVCADGAYGFGGGGAGVLGTVAPDTSYRVAWRAAESGYAKLSGLAGVGDNAPAGGLILPASQNEIDIGHSDGADHAGGYIAFVSLIAGALSDAEIDALAP